MTGVPQSRLRYAPGDSIEMLPRNAASPVQMPTQHQRKAEAGDEDPGALAEQQPQTLRGRDRTRAEAALLELMEQTAATRT